MSKITTNLLFVWGPERTTSAYPVTTDLRARKSTVAITAIIVTYTIIETVCACAHAVQTYHSSITQITL